jgi:hypothetical protein
MGSASKPGDAAEVAADGVEAAADTDDVKRKFREALERKQSKQADGSAGGDGGEHGKVHSAHGPAHQQRQFRRKSGG